MTKQGISIVFIFLLSILALQATTLKQGKSAMIKSFYDNKRVLVTGGCGFIGSEIVDLLVECNAHVTIIDDLSTGFEENIAAVNNRVKFINKSITDTDACLEATKDQDIIFHLAAFISVPLSVDDPKRCHEVNVNGTLNLLEAARINNVERFIFSSSAAVYGEPSGECTEDLPCNPTSPYGFSKLIGEQYVRQYATVYGIKGISLRYFNVYGPRQNPNGHYAAVVAKFNDLMAHNKPLTVFGDGQQTRDFVPVEKVAESNLLAGILASDTNKGNVYNIATGKTMNLLDLIDQLAQKHPNWQRDIRFAPARAGDIKHSSASIRRFENELTMLTVQ